MCIRDRVKWAAYLPPEQGTPKADELPTFYAAVVQDLSLIHIRGGADLLEAAGHLVPPAPQQIPAGHQPRPGSCQRTAQVAAEHHGKTERPA